MGGGCDIPVLSVMGGEGFCSEGIVDVAMSKERVLIFRGWSLETLKCKPSISEGNCSCLFNLLSNHIAVFYQDSYQISPSSHLTKQASS